MFNQKPNQVPKEKKEDNDCEISVKRDKQGRIVGLKSKGKCTKEDRLIFARENNIDIE